MNDGEDPATWEARRDTLKAKGYNGNGAGTPLAVASAMWPTANVPNGWRSSSTSNYDAAGNKRQIDLAAYATRQWGRNNGQKSETDTGSILPLLRDEVGTEALWDEAGGSGDARSAPLLRPDVYGGSDGEGGANGSHDVPLASAAIDGEADDVFRLRCDEERAVAPHRREAPEQHTGEPPSGVRVMPHETSPSDVEDRAERTGQGPRRLNPRFCEWLMGLPIDWTAEVPRVDRLRCLGNAVVAPQAAYAIALLVTELAAHAQTETPHE